MAHSKTSLFTSTELLDLYGIPVLTDTERQEYFTFNEKELSILNNFKDVKDALYFATSLVFFKIKNTFITFKCNNVINEYDYVRNCYFPDQPLPKHMPTESTKKRIHLKISELCQAKRLNGEMAETIYSQLQEIATYAPRQRQLLRELLNLLIKHRVIIPGQTTLQNIISKVWNIEHKRILQAYNRYTTRKQRQSIAKLLQEEDQDNLNIVALKTEIKSFHTHELWKEIDKQKQLQIFFDLAKTIIQKLNLPFTTCQYYASLVQYYDRSRMRKIDPQKTGLYLLCYIYITYQTTNDTLIDAFKKRVHDMIGKAFGYADEQRLKQLDKSEETRKHISEMMLMVHKRPSLSILKKRLYQHVPKEDWEAAAYSLVDQHFNKKMLFWVYIDLMADSIKLSIRALFTALDLTHIKKNSLSTIIEHMKTHINDGTIAQTPYPSSFKNWIDKKQQVHVVKNNEIVPHRFEFLVYKKIVNDLNANKIKVQHSFHYKDIEDEIIDRKTWKQTKKARLEKLNYPKLSNSFRQTFAEKKKESMALYKTVNESIEKGENKVVIIKKNKKGERVWRLRPIESVMESEESLFATIKQQSIVDVIKFVNKETNFIQAFEPLLPKGTRLSLSIEYLSAGILANAIRMGGRKMSDTSDLNESTLLNIETNYILIENLCQAIDLINNQTAKFKIFDQWYMNSIIHSTLDALKLNLTFDHHKGRNSRKYFGCGLGVAAYNHIINGLSVTGKLIGAHEYEGDYTFELATMQNTSDIKVSQVSTDKHGMNMFNFALFDMIGIKFTPRVPKPHREVLWGFGKPEDYAGMLIKPTQFVDENLILDEEDNIKRMMASFLSGHVSSTLIIRKMSKKEYHSQTKKALMHYNNLERSMHNLRMTHDPDYRHYVTMMLNRGEAYNNLYRAITLLNNGELRGKSETEMEMWHQCTRFIAAVIHYYNTYILNTLYERATSDEERKFLASMSPTAWAHLILLGFYQFFTESNENWVDDFLNQWDWKKAASDIATKDKSKK